MKVLLIVSLASLLAVSHVFAGELVLESKATQSVLVELYTSEGCSSCPPAERYLNSFTRHNELWTHYIPVAFHVDYWDYLGWKDRFSKAQYSQRQRQYAQSKQQRSVYTPAFMVNGENWRPGFYNKNIATPNTRAGNLKLLIKDRQIFAEFHPLIDAPAANQLNVALLGMGIESNIKAGENSGKRAHHEFVVLFHQQYPSASNQWQVALPVYHAKDITRFAIAAWINVTGDPTPLQSVGGSLPLSYMQ